ncbi:TetR/AcrR family transcriptional regulator [Paractinoplanes lichenicola]|uniref:WHG domain-containing protein n=1 Tax=Paractinoplanes lichenicola TaxID=2802976 RepID=A0ABS1VEC1_9ACTN|nr:TetR-like C-terminal domain-containing protein [Actinoplanes lichenicola]MBL7253022.1 WHG domain-containing protein [Actinoplanes lichenicola]
MPRAGLNTEVLVGVALDLVDEKGLEALSLAALADRAGVAGPSLYKHMGSLASLRGLMALAVVRQLTAMCTTAVMGRSREDAVEALMRHYRAFAVEHPGRYALVPLNALQDPAVAAAGAELLAVFGAVLRAYGLEGSEATHAIRRMRATVHGFVVLETGGGFGLPEDVEASFDQVVTMVLRSLE